MITSSPQANMLCSTLRSAARARGSALPRPLSSLALKVYGGKQASPAAAATFAAWHECLDGVLYNGMDSSKAMEVLKPHMDEECVFKPPTYFAPWTGRDEALLLLSCVSEVFGPSFTYGRQWLSDDGCEWALEFEASIGDTGKTVQGIDLVSLCEESGRIKDFTVLARPPNAVEALKKAMMQKVPMRLAKLKARQALGL